LDKKKEILNAPIEFALGLKFFKQQKYILSIENLNIAENKFQSPELYLIRGIANLKTGNLKKAEKDFNYVMKNTKDPEEHRRKQ